ncbi:autoinducer binding domain-containing protein [uncultured Roseovarius sp.]|uniref:helix-turn-helix transcriptional regulator n=1 Tax=uncultured Roseovarius sp. TaxID=293344 RepID=UPI0026081A56|nr:autoinducer binding domain-containing protein [uncultured Roseovarius sp.]
MKMHEIKALSAAELFAESLETISSIGTEGYFVMVNHSRKGPEFIQSSYPQEWQTEYDENSYHLKDPAFLWSLAKNGSRRWSEIKLPDPSGVMKKARRYGLIYGAIFSKGFLTKKSVFSVARDDRELTDDEMTWLADWFERYVTACNRQQAFSIKELDVLQCLSNDMTVEEAADHLNISASAAKARLKTARDRYGVKTNTWMVATALRSNLIN